MEIEINEYCVSKFCQHGRATVPDSWSNIILDISVRVLLNEIYISMGGLTKAISTP